MRRYQLSSKHRLIDYLETPQGRQALEKYLNEGIELGRRSAQGDFAYALSFSPDGLVQRSRLTADDAPIEAQPVQERADREEYQRQYGSIYSVRQNADFPRSVPITLTGPAGVVLKEIGPTGEVEFGTVGSGQRSVDIVTYAGGFEITEDLEEFGESWVLDEISEALGRADVLLDNEIHFRPILSGSYSASAQQGGKLIDKSADTAETLDSDQAALQEALKALPDGRILITGIDMIWRLGAVFNRAYENGSNILLRQFLGPNSVIVYEGGQQEVGARVFEYPGVEPLTAYLVVPRQQFRSYIKHGLRVTSHEGDMSRLITRQIVARKRLGVWADISGRYGAVKIRFKA